MRLCISCILFVMCLTLAASVFAKDERLEKLPIDQRQWLEEDVVYIITDKERELFLSLSTVEERERFMDVFWDRRDPNPATLENEFKVEHYERIAFANQQFGRETTRPGWATDRGRFYIILGKPAERQRYDGQNEVVDCEIWFYSGEVELRTPPRFNLLFYRENNIGEYELYHPFGDGPEELLQTGFLLGADQNKAIDILELVSMDLAKASLTIDLSEPVSDFLSRRNSIDPMTLYVRPSMSVDRNLADIEASPQRRVNTDYIDAYLRYGSKVSAEYSFKFVPNRHYFAVLAGPQNTSFVHYSIEMDPEHFSLEANEDGTRFYTTLDVSLEVTDLKESLIAYNDNTAAIELSASQLQQAQAYPFVYQDNFPLVVPGNYKLTVTVRNRVTKEFTVAEEEILIPSLDGKPNLSDIIVGYQEELVPTAREDEYLTFQVGNTRVYPAVENIFAIGETVHVLTHVEGAAAGSGVRFTLLNGEETLHESETELEVSSGLVMAQIPLLKISGGNYLLRAELVGPAGSVVAVKSTAVNVSPRSFIPRPAFVYRRGFNTGVAGLLSLARGQQLLALGQVQPALTELEEAVAAGNPELTMARWKLAGALIYSREADRALELLLPLEDDYPSEYEVVEGLAFAYYIKKEFALAVEHFEKALNIRSPDVIVLNALGDCYQELGRSEEAKKAFELSLQINPGQTGVKERIQSLSE